MIYATHDHGEALTLADQIAVDPADRPGTWASFESPRLIPRRRS